MTENLIGNGMKRILAVIALAALITGCATKPISTELAKSVPEKQILDKSLLTPKENTGKVIIKRDSGFMGSGCLSTVYVDGKEIANLDPAEKIEIYPSVGRHIFSAWPKGLCGGGMSEQEGVVVNDKTIMYRIGYGTNGDYGIYPTAF